MGHATTATYDNTDMPLTVTDALGHVTTYVYNAKGMRTSVTDANGKVTSFAYDAADRLTTVTDPLSQTVTYAYDAAGRVTSRTDAKSQATTYTYDVVNRPTYVNYPFGTSDVSFTYDALGNRLTMTDGTGTTTTALDALYRPTSVTDGASNVVGYSVLQDSAGNRYVYGLDLISREASGGSLEYYLTDGLGSTTALSDGAGNVTGTYEYDAFGAVRAHTGAATEWSYTGEQHDATGLEYLQARYYDASTGRFISRDPLPLMQRYAYVGGNPVNYADASGLRRTPLNFSPAKMLARMILDSACWHKNKCAPHYEWYRAVIAAAKRGWGRGVGRGAGNVECSSDIRRRCHGRGALRRRQGGIGCGEDSQPRRAVLRTVEQIARVLCTLRDGVDRRSSRRRRSCIFGVACAGLGVETFGGSILLCAVATPSLISGLTAGGVLVDKSTVPWHEKE